MFEDSSGDEDIMADLLVQAATVVAENGTPWYVCIHLANVVLSYDIFPFM